MNSSIVLFHNDRFYFLVSTILFSLELVLPCASMFSFCASKLGPFIVSSW